MKYITFRVGLSDNEMAFEAFITFHEHLTHSEMFEAIKDSVGKQCGSSGEHVEALGAGFVYYNGGFPSCVGCSDSMNLKNRGELDDEILRRDTQANFVNSPRDVLEALNDTLYNAIWNIRRAVELIREHPVYIVFRTTHHPNLIEESPAHKLELGDPISYIGPTVDKHGNGAHIVRFDETEFATVNAEFFRRHVFPFADYDSIMELRENGWKIVPPTTGEFYGFDGSFPLTVKSIELVPDTKWGLNPEVIVNFEDDKETIHCAEDRLETMIENLNKYMLDGFVS